MSDTEGFTIEDGKLKEYVGEAVEVTIPDSVTSIGKWAFSDCDNLVISTPADSFVSCIL